LVWPELRITLRSFLNAERLTAHKILSSQWEALPPTN
jgi:hypothetical protein